ncbi:MAG TPA: VWA domain-containing protein [Bryobacteraceae bacterium]|nr:VWA domain-containing protein [Bryobacteraceae bacterium]
MCGKGAAFHCAVRLALALFGPATIALAQQSPVIKVNVRLVHVLATVKDEHGQPVTGLRKSDFHIADNGVPQDIAIFEPRTEQPLSVSVLIDTSGSTGIELKYETDSVARFFRELVREGNPDDAAALYTFNWEVWQVNNFTRNIPRLEQRLKQLHSDGGTSLYDALYLAARDLEDREGRHVVIVVTDGGDTTSSKDYRAALRSCHNADVVLYPILVIPIRNDAGRNTGGENALTTLAQGTGGHVFAPSLGPQLDRAFGDILRELRTQYFLGYYPKNLPYTKELFHQIRVTVDHPGLRVVTRTGYYGEAEESSSREVR